MGVFQPDDVMKVEPTNAHLVSNGLHEMVNILYYLYHMFGLLYGV